MVWFGKIEPKTKEKASYTIFQVQYIALAFCKSYKLQVQYIALVIYCTCGISQMSFVKLKKRNKNNSCELYFFYFTFYAPENERRYWK